MSKILILPRRALVTGAAERLAQTVEKVAEWVSMSRAQHADETRVPLAGKLHRPHGNNAHFLTHLAWHEKPSASASRFHG